VDLVRDLVRAMPAAGGMAPKAGPDFTGEVHALQVGLHQALIALDGGADSKSPAKSKGGSAGGGVARLRQLISAYEEQFGLKAEWQFGEEYRDRATANKAKGFYRLMIDLAHVAASSGDVPSNFIQTLKTWQKSTCHNIVVQDLKKCLPKK
jgi:hypothetical protein